MKCPYCGLERGIDANGLCLYCKAHIKIEVDTVNKPKSTINKTNTKKEKNQ